LQTDETSSGDADADDILLPSTDLVVTTSKGDIVQVATLAKPQAETPQPIISSPALVVCQGWDRFPCFKALLSSPIGTLVENSGEMENILEEIQPRVPMTLPLKPWPVVTLPVFRSRMQK
jgi:hypothetical protein